MRFQFTRRFRRDYRHLPQRVQDQVLIKLRLLAENPHHPSLRIKHLQGRRDPLGRPVWEMSVTMSYRLTFVWEGDVAILRRVGSHDLLDEEAR